MKDNELIDFVDWLIKSEEAPKGSSFEETVSWINELSSTDDGKKILNQLINTYKGTSMFKNGGKLDYIFYLKSGGKCKVTKHQSTSIIPVGMENKQRRSDKDGYYYMEKDGTKVLTTDHKGTFPLRGSQYQMPGYEAPMSTYISGAPGYRKVKVYNDYENVLWPLAKYSENEPNFIQKIFGWRQASPEYWQKVDNALKVNNFQDGGTVDNYKWNDHPTGTKGYFYDVPSAIHPRTGGPIRRSGVASPDGNIREYSYGDYTVIDNVDGRTIRIGDKTYSDSSRPTYWTTDGKSNPVYPTVEMPFKAKMEIDMLDNILGLPPGENSIYRKIPFSDKMPMLPVENSGIIKHGDGGKNEPKYRDRGTRYSYPEGVERTESQETLKYPEGTMTRRITSQNGQRDTIIEGIDKRYWKEANAEFDKYKNSQKKK